MKDLGSQLAEARTQRGLTLSELSRRTKIGLATLQAIERNELADLPGGIYRRGFLRAYAREVGCDPEEIVRQYCAQFVETDADAFVALTRSPNGVHVTERVRAKEIDAEDRKRAYGMAMTVGVAAVTGLALTLVHSSLRPQTGKPAVRAGVSALTLPKPPPLVQALPSHLVPPTVPPSPATPREELGTAGASGTLKAVDNATDQLRLVIRPIGETWLAGTADGTQLVYRLLSAGELVSIDARDDVVLRVGDPAAFAFTINGIAGRTLGSAGQAITVHLTRQNYSEFQAR